MSNEKRPKAETENEELARLREENALLKRGNPQWTHDEEIRHLAALPVLDPAHARTLLPQRWVALQERGSWTCAIYLCTLGTKSPHYRLTKIDWPPWLDPTQGPALRIWDAAQRVVDRKTLGIVPEPYKRAAILAIEAGNFKPSVSGYSHEEIAGAFHEIFGKGRIGHHNRIKSLVQPVMRLAGLLTEEARPLCPYFQVLEEGKPLPQEWLDLHRPTDVDPIVYEMEAPIPAPPEPADAYKPPTTPASLAGPGRY
jgi:hypothetical protein